VKTVGRLRAWTASSKKALETKQLYERLKTRIKHRPALVATARLLTRTLHEVLARGKPYAADPAPEMTVAQADRLVRYQTGVGTKILTTCSEITRLQVAV
jgi:hypothetical protein